MIKVHQPALIKRIEGMTAPEVVTFLRKTQDASGIKVCTAVTPGDPAYRDLAAKERTTVKKEV